MLLILHAVPQLLYNQTPTSDISALPGSLHQTQILPPVPNNTQDQDTVVFCD